jgi:CHAD domain-containing protein
MTRHQIVWDASKSAKENASQKLPRLAQKYFLAGRALFHADASSEVLHRFRLDTKRFRYTLELFRPCYGPGLDRRLDVLRNIQDFLGEINDCSATQKLVGRQDKKILSFLERRLSQKRGAIRNYWQQTFDADGQERWWTDYLARFARKAGHPV